MNITAVVVTYDPPAGFLDRVAVWRSQVDQLLLVDNGSAIAWRNSVCPVIQEKFPNVEFLFNEENLGIGAALNLGLSRLLERGLEFAFVFDQDSQPGPGMIAELFEVYNNHVDRSRTAIVAPNVDIPAAKVTYSFLVPRGRFLFNRTRCGGQKVLQDVSVVILSGALYDLRAYRQIGPFREDFFIDYVDTEYCLRARQRGYNIAVACRAQLSHQMGDQREKQFGPLTMHPTFYSPLRWYYISRNRIRMITQYALRFPYWFLYELVINLYGLARLVLFEDRKVAKVLAIALGILDGLRNRMGPVSRTRYSWLIPNENGR
jgi:rhamnosyltransferase